MKSRLSFFNSINNLALETTNLQIYCSKFAGGLNNSNMLAGRFCERIALQFKAVLFVKILFTKFVKC